MILYKKIVPLLLVTLMMITTVNGSENKIKVLATTGMIADAVRDIGGDKVEVIQLMPSGSDPHSYKITAGDLRRFTVADIIFYNGLHLEANIYEALTIIPKAHAVSDAIPKNKLINVGGDDLFDPHIWMDVELWSNILPYITMVLSQFQSENSDIFAKNARNTSAKYKQLSITVTDIIGRIPEKFRILLTAHDAFSYFGKAYGMKIYGVQGISTKSTVGIKKISELAVLVLTEKIPAIFTESSVSEITIYSLKKAVEHKGWKIKLGEELFSDSMGQAGSQYDNYIGMMEANANRIMKGLTEQQKENDE